MADYEETLLIVSFLRSEGETSSEALVNIVSPVSEFFARESERLGIVECELREDINVHRSGGRGTRPKDHGEGLLYEAPFAEAKYRVKFREKGALAYVYNRWCTNPPKLDAWLSRGSDQHLFDGFDPHLLKEKFALQELSLGVIINLTDFYPENIIDCSAQSSENIDKDQPIVSAEVR